MQTENYERKLAAAFRVRRDGRVVLVQPPEKPRWWRVEAHIKLHGIDEGRSRMIVETVEARDLIDAVMRATRQYPRLDCIEVEARQTRAPSVRIKQAARPR